MESPSPIQAASEVAIAHGLQFEQAIVLQNLSNVILHLSPTAVVARVSTMTATQRQGDGWFAREVAVAEYLTQVGALSLGRWWRWCGRSSCIRRIRVLNGS